MEVVDAPSTFIILVVILDAKQGSCLTLMAEFEAVPAPWLLRGEAHFLLSWLGKPGAAAAQRPFGSRRAKVLGFVRYTDSNVGPYDELLWLSPWGLPLHGRRLHTVERIFVSSEASCYSGRLNWGIPKELARFEVHRASPSSQSVQVATPAGPLASFEVATGEGAMNVDLASLPEAFRTLGQTLDGRRFEVTPTLRGQLHRACFSELWLDSRQLGELSSGRALGGCSVLGLEMRFPEATIS
jgi:hypothetical protein